MLGLDTTAIIDFFRGDERVRKFLEAHSGPLVTNTFNEFEIFFGIGPENPAHADETAYYDGFFNKTHRVVADRKSLKRASAIHWQLRRKGAPISKFDCAIAACFLENGVKKILTRNAKHFEKIDGLEIISY